MEVIITKKDCINAHFDHIRRDPLMNALKRQMPDIKPKAVYADHFITEDHKSFEFDSSENGYSRGSVDELMKNTKKEIHLRLTPS